LANILERKGDYGRSIERLKELIASDPVNEEAHRQLMHLYALTGKRHQALQQYRRCCDILRKEFDQDPETATSALHRQIVSSTARPLRTSVAGHHQFDDSLTILPLANLNLNRGSECFCDTITEKIINSLSASSGLRIMSWSVVSRFKGREIDPLAVGR